MKTITTRELRQNPATMIKDVEAGEVYSLTLHGREVGTIVPSRTHGRITPPKKDGGANTISIEKRALTSASNVDELLDDMRGRW